MAIGSLGISLKLDQELYLSDKNGVVQAGAIARATLGSLVKIYKTDGSYYEGNIKTIKEDNDSLEIQGSIINCNASFGFKIAKGGVFVGAVVEHETKKTYVLEFSLPHKGYVLVYSTKYNIDA